MTRADAYDHYLSAVRRESSHFARLVRRREARHAAIRREIARARQSNWRAWVCGWIHQIIGR